MKIAVAIIMLSAVGLSYASVPNSAGNSAVRVVTGNGQGGQAYTPPKGSAERKAILNALRAEMKRLHGTEAVFTVRYLKVYRGWAWLETSPQSADGANQYEGVSALLRRRTGRWRVAEIACAEDDNPDCFGHADFFRRLRGRFPDAPRGIFP